METVMVHAAEAYPVYIGGGLLDRCGELAARHSNGRCAVICDETTVWCAPPA